jgi:Tfp pilus assembly protein PilE
LLGSSQVNSSNFFLSRNGKKTKILNGDGVSIYEFELLPADATSFTFRARTAGAQLNDRDCQSLTVNAKGQRTATARQGRDFSACWR